MGLYQFTNRRRAKDAIMQVLDRYSADGMTVFVSEEVVYVNLEKDIPDAPAVMHYGDIIPQGIGEILDLDTVTELYKGSGIARFRV